MLKRRKNRIHPGLSVILVLLMSFVGISGIFAAAESADAGSRTPVYKSLEEMNGKRIGVQVGTASGITSRSGRQTGSGL